MLFRLLLLTLGLLILGTAFSQDSTRLDKLLSAPDKLFGALSKKSRQAEDRLTKATQSYLQKLQKREQKLYRKLYKKDSLKAKEIFGDIDARYAALKRTSGKAGRYSATYSGRLDSLSTSLSLLKDNGLLQNSSALNQTLSGYKDLQQQLNASEQIKKQLAKRSGELKQKLSAFGLTKGLRKFQKDVYYYRAQVQEYKALWEDPSKLEAKLLEVVQRLPQFKDFFARNSQLGRLFPMPGGNGTGAPSAALAGLQTRAMVTQAIQQRFGSGADVTQALQQNVQSAQGQLNQLKARAASLGQGSVGSAGEGDLPDFKPNEQKTKTFLNRLEYGANVQSQKARYYFPATSDLGLQLGYKLNDNSTIGIGASYKLGLGRGWNHIAITHQGVGLRSYVDWKLKGSLYLSGGYEQNYQSEFQRLDVLKDLSAWQRSGLIGVSKKYKVSKKMKGEMKLLWDFLSYNQIPRTQAILFRVGYNLK